MKTILKNALIITFSCFAFTSLAQPIVQNGAQIEFEKEVHDYGENCQWWQW